MTDYMIWEVKNIYYLQKIVIFITITVIALYRTRLLSPTLDYQYMTLVP